MKRLRFFPIAACLIMLFSACTTTTKSSSSSGGSTPSSNSSFFNDATSDSAGDDGRSALLVIGNESFPVTLQDHASARALLQLFPMTLTMEELHGNEKFHYLQNPLPTDRRPAGEIHAGDLMLYGDDCLVLFYESFPSTYQYTPLGRVDNAEQLAQALGQGQVTVTFRLQ